MNILLTGASGFLGKSIFDRFIGNNDLVTIGRGAFKESTNHLIHDLSQNVISLPQKNYHKIIHCAGKAHVFPKTEKEAQYFFDVNETGTKKLLQALDNLQQKPKQFILISTVAVYGLIKGELITEDHCLKPNTPYGISKLNAENLVTNWCISNNVNYLILRLPLIAGKNPPGNLGDMKQAISKGYYVRIGNNKARKSIVVAEDVASLIERINTESGIFHLTDGYHPLFHEVETAIENRLGKSIKIKIPFWLLGIIAKIGDFFTAILKNDMPITSLRLEKITSTLTFDDSKAKQELDWNPQNTIEFIESYI